MASSESHLPGEATRGKRLALVIGVNQTNSPSLSQLHSALTDAEAIAKELQDSCGFDLCVPSLLGKLATSEVIRKAIRKLARDRTDDEFLLLYFSGHAHPMQVEAGRSTVYLGSSDFDERDIRYEDGDDVKYEEEAHVSFHWLRKRLFEETRAGRVLLILDCCYAGSMGRTTPDHYLEELQERIGYYFEGPSSESRARPGGLRLALTATGHNQVANENNAQGLMTGFLLSALRGEVADVLEVEQGGALSLQRLHRYLEVVMPLEQRPSVSGDYASRSCILAYYPERAAQMRRISIHVAGAERPQTYIPFPRDLLFQPRPNEFEHIEHLLIRTDIAHRSARVGLVGVTGMGGVGKTQLAIELAYRFQEQKSFPAGIFWTPAFGTSRAAWQHHLAELAFQSGYLPPDDDLSNPENEARRVRHLTRYFASHADALLILDNVDDPTLINVFLPSFAGGELACALLYTSRLTQAPPDVTIHSVEILSEPAALHLLLQTTRSALLTDALAGSQCDEACAARRVCEIVGYLPLALVHLRSYLSQDRQMSLLRLVEVLNKRGILTIVDALTATLQLSWDRVRTEEARRLFQLAAYFPEAAPIPLWLLGLAAGLGEEGDIFEPLGQARLHLQELSLLEELSGQQVRLHPLVRAFGQHQLQQEGDKKSNMLRTQAVQRLVVALCDLTLLEQRARLIGYRACLEQVRSAREYAISLTLSYSDQLIHLERAMDCESYLLADTQWWPEILPALFYQQLFNRAVETENAFSNQQPPACWIQQMKSVGTKDHTFLRMLSGHVGAVNSVAFSPDGQLVLTGSEDRTVRLWESSTGILRAILQGHINQVVSVVFSPYGRLMLTISFDGTACLWESGTGRLHVILQGYIDEARSAAFSPDSGVRVVPGISSDEKGAFSPDGQLVLTVSLDGTAACLWESSTGRHRATLQGHTDRVNSVAFSPDGQLVLTGSSDKTARLWESSTGVLRAILQGHTGKVESVTFSPDGSMVLTGSADKTACVWETNTGQLRATHHYTSFGFTSKVSSVAFSPDGQLILTGSDRGARLWESNTGQLRAILSGYIGKKQSVAFSPDGQLILTGSTNGVVRLWESRTGQRRATLLGHTDRVQSVAFSPDGQLILTGSDDKTARLWECNSNPLWSHSGWHIDKILSMAFSADGRLVLTGSVDKTACLWESRTGRHRATLLGHTNSVQSVAFSPNGQLVLTGSMDNTVRLWESRTGRHRATLHGHTMGVLSVVFSPDGQLILTGSSDKTARLWKSGSRTLHAILRGHTGQILSVAFSPDGQLALTGSADRTARLWECSTGRHRATLHGHTAAVMGVAFSPDGRLVLTGSADKTARLWESRTGQHRATLQGHTNSVQNVAFSPDGHLALTSDTKGWTFFWHIQRVDMPHLPGQSHLNLSASSTSHAITNQFVKPGFTDTHYKALESLETITLPHPLSFYVTVDYASSFWQDTTHLLLADGGGGSGRPFIYHLHLEGPCWQEKE